MKTLKELAKIDNLVMSTLKTTEIRHLIAGSEKGDLSLMLRKDESHKEYRFLLDSVPVTDEQNVKLFHTFNDILFVI